MKVEIYKLSELEEKDADKAVEVSKVFARVKKFKTIPAEVVKKHLEKAGLDISLEGEAVLVGKKKYKGKVLEFILNSEEDDNPWVLIEDGGISFEGEVKKGTKRKTKVTGPVLEEIKKILSDKGEIRMGDVWKELHEKGHVKHRAQLYQIIKRHCEVKYIENGKRREMVITGLKA